jgi:hypothetical protein
MTPAHAEAARNTRNAAGRIIRHQTPDTGVEVRLRGYSLQVKILGGFIMLELEQYKYSLSEIWDAIEEIEVSL